MAYNIVFSAIGVHQGQTYPGVQYGFTSVLTSIDQTRNNIYYNDFRDNRVFKKPIEGGFKVGNEIEKIRLSNNIQNPIYLSVGGDHSCSYGTVWATKQVDPEMKLIWIDAHADINTPETSYSGNCHGMPVAYIMGLARNINLDSKPILRPDQLVYIGLRCVDKEEEVFLKELEKQGTHIFTTYDVQVYGIRKILDGLNFENIELVYAVNNISIAAFKAPVIIINTKEIILHPPFLAA